MLITCLRCPRGLHATTETMNLRVSLSLVRVHVCACKCTWIYPIDVARVAQRELEGGREGVRLTTFAVTLPTQALSFDRPVDRVGYAPLQAGSR